MAYGIKLLEGDGEGYDNYEELTATLLAVSKQECNVK